MKLLPWVLLALVIVAGAVIYYLWLRPPQHATVVGGVASVVKAVTGGSGTSSNDPDATLPLDF